MTKMKNLGWKQCHCTTLLLSLRAFFFTVIASEAWQSRGETKPIPVKDIVYGIIVYKLQDC